MEIPCLVGVMIAGGPAFRTYPTRGFAGTATLTLRANRALITNVTGRTTPVAAH